MSNYLVIARKWRPQKFDEVVGQPHVTRTLQNSVRSGRIAHAYLFTGARGIGKTSVARILAKALNCADGPTPEPCGQCSNCREITQGSAVDVLEVDGASNRGIDNVRELRETVRYRPAKGRYKIYIIDEVHMLTTEAFNALLKTLEEPPAHVIFIFATTEPHKLPATILSRCQRFDFRRIAIQDLVKHLRRITAEEKVEFSDNVLYALAREADGSMRDSQSLLEQLLSFSGEGLPDEEILDILGVVDRRSILRSGEAILSGNARECLDIVEDLYRRGIDSRRFCQQLCDHFRNLLYLVLGGKKGENKLDLPAEESEILMRQAAKTGAESLYLYFQTALKGEEEIRRSSIPKITLEMLLLRMAQMPRIESLDSALKAIGRIEKMLAGGLPGGVAADPDSSRGPVSAPEAGARTGSERPAAPVEAPAKRREKQAEAPDPPTSPEPGPRPHFGAGEISTDGAAARASDLSDYPPPEPVVKAASADEAAADWAAFLKWLETKDPVNAAKLGQSTAEAQSGDLIRIEVLEMFEKAVTEPASAEKLNRACAEFFGREFKWTVCRKSEKGHGPEARRSKAATAKKFILEHPAVLQALEVLGGELVEVRTPGTKDAGKPRGRSGSFPRGAE